MPADAFETAPARRRTAPREHYEHRDKHRHRPFRRDLTFAYIMEFTARQEIVARRCEEIHHLSVFSEPCLVLEAGWNDRDVPRAAPAK
jgi:hypothetical protein